ncbi:UNVERIFIED_CONTAM: hypothetical protein Slati_0090500 [Sesamum latifolium]|uniref:Uncharacterized protein n=1 Tax=Sesamum latifolium TaxID=2727402 RepID=A0AAW2Y8K1_9LAMI
MSMGRVFCPKPRRVGPSNSNNTVLLLRFHIRNDVMAFDSKPGAEFLDFIIREVKVDYASVDGVFNWKLRSQSKSIVIP